MSKCDIQANKQASKVTSRTRVPSDTLVENSPILVVDHVVNHIVDHLVNYVVRTHTESYKKNLSRFGIRKR